MSENIKKSDDGTYRWVYEFNMLKNPIILLTVLKIFLLVLVGMCPGSRTFRKIMGNSRQRGKAERSSKNRARWENEKAIE